MRARAWYSLVLSKMSMGIRTTRARNAKWQRYTPGGYPEDARRKEQRENVESIVLAEEARSW